MAVTIPRSPIFGPDTKRPWSAVQHGTWIWSNPNIYTNPVPRGKQTDFDVPNSVASIRQYRYPIDLRTWISHNSNTQTNVVPAGKQSDFSTPPQIFRYDPSLKTWVYLPVPAPAVQAPFAQYDWPLPATLIYPRSLLTAISENPNVYTNPVPVGEQSDFSTPYQVFRFDPDRRTWVWQNVNTYTNAFPAGKSTDYSTPPQIFRFDPALKTWINENPNIFTNQTPIGDQSDFSTPPQVFRFDPAQRTWILQNSSLYTNVFPAGESTDYSTPYQIFRYDPALKTWVYLPIPAAPVAPNPFAQYDWPIPISLIYPRSLLTITIGNPGVYTNPVPVGEQTDLSTPPQTFRFDPLLKTWVSGNPNLFTNSFPVGQRSDFSTPPQVFRFDPAQRTWVWQNSSAYTNTFPPGISSDFSVPPQIYRYDPASKTWVYVPIPVPPSAAIPFAQYDWPVPIVLVYPRSLLTTIAQNSNLYTNVFPPGKIAFELAVARQASIDLRTLISQNPNLFPPPVPPPPGQVLDHFISIGVRIAIS